MTENLTQAKCSACTGDSPPVTETEMQTLKPQIPDWQIEDHNGERHLKRQFSLANFQQALDFTNRVGEAAEAEGHHPAVLTEWGKVTVSWWTHAINGLHKNDFIMAAKTDAIAQQFNS